MRSARLIPAIGMLLLCASCASRPVLSVAPNACSGLIPERWRGGVESAPFPASAELQADPATAWRLFGVRQTGSLDEANARTADSIAIVEACERRDKEAADQLARPWWRFW